jgi:hypothetical protein
MSADRVLRGPLQFSTTRKVLFADSPFTITNEAVIYVSTAGGAVSLTLPASIPTATGGPNRILTIIDVGGSAGSSNITINRAGSDTINGGTSYVLSVNYGVATLFDAHGGVWQAVTDSDPSQAQTATNGTVTTLTSTNATITTANVTTLNVAGFTSDTDVANAAALGTVIGNATQLSHAINIVTGANDAAGVILPVAAPGKRVEVYNQDTNGTHGLKCYPAVNSSINNAAANAAVNIEGWTLARFVGLSSTLWASSFTVNA